MINQSNFSWILGNIKEKSSKKAIGQEYFIKQIGGYKVGVYGFAGKEFTESMDPLGNSFIY